MQTLTKKVQKTIIQSLKYYVKTKNPTKLDTLFYIYMKYANMPGFQNAFLKHKNKLTRIDLLFNMDKEALFIEIQYCCNIYKKKKRPIFGTRMIFPPNNNRKFFNEVLDIILEPEDE
jgi:hypothetical protein